MPIILLNAVLLFGLVAVAIPPIIHLLNRKRFDVVRWGAMRFLQVSERTRRRVFLEELLLMLVRMSLIAVMVLALAAPADRSGWFRLFGDRGSRDVVLVFDGSYSMAYAGPSGTAHAAAQKWALDLLDDLGPGDGVAVLQAKQQVLAPVAEPTSDFDLVRSAVRTLTAPRGGCDWPGGLQAAVRCFAKSPKVQQEIIVLTDGQRQGWADDATLLRWELLAGQQSEGRRPRIWVVNLDPDRPPAPANWSLGPLRASRAVAAVGQQVRFRTVLQRYGEGELEVPRRIKLETDGRPAGDVPSVSQAAGAPTTEKGQVPLSVRPRFTAAGSHLVTVQFDGDPLPGDNRQDYAVEILPALPVLLVDGEPDSDAPRRGVDFLRDALAPARDPSPSVFARVVSVADFAPDLLARDVGGTGTVPRVVVLSNVARLTPAQEAAIGKFVADGGGLLVTLGDRVDTRHYNEFLYRGGRGWLPAALAEPVGDVNDTTRAAQPIAASLFHPALELFRESVPGGLADARFPRHWTLKTGAADNAITIARLSGDAPLFAERSYQAGRVILSAVPLDNSWRTNLIELPAFAPLAHELVFYLAAARSAAGNLSPGQPIRYVLPKDSPADGWAMQPPDGEAKRLAATDGQLLFDETREPGVYRLSHAASGVTRYYVVQGDARESDLTPCSDADRELVRKMLPTLEYANDRRDVVNGLLRSPQPTELWWLVMAGVIGLLSIEVWLTRQRARAALA